MIYSLVGEDILYVVKFGVVRMIGDFIPQANAQVDTPARATGALIGHHATEFFALVGNGSHTTTPFVFVISSRRIISKAIPLICVYVVRAGRAIGFTHDIPFDRAKKSCELVSLAHPQAPRPTSL